MSYLTVIDEALDGTSSEPFHLEFPAERITVQELIRSRVYQEVQDRNIAARQGQHPSLVVPEADEVRLNGRRQPARHLTDWKTAFEKALDAFRRGQILILINHCQATSLDQEIVVQPTTLITFVKLILLTGG